MVFFLMGTRKIIPKYVVVRHKISLPTDENRSPGNQFPYPVYLRLALAERILKRRYALQRSASTVYLGNIAAARQPDRFSAVRRRMDHQVAASCGDHLKRIGPDMRPGINERLAERAYRGRHRQIGATPAICRARSPPRVTARVRRMAGAAPICRCRPR